MKNLVFIVLILSSTEGMIQAKCYNLPKTEQSDKTEIHPRFLPEGIRKDITENYSGARIITAKRIGPADNPKGYEVQISYQNKNILIEYDENGKLLHKNGE